MRKIIRKYKKIYSAQKGQHRKRLVVENAYNEIISVGARFVRQNEGKDEWVEVLMHEALEKVAHTIRYKPRGSKEDSADIGEEEEEDQSAPDRPLTMAANTVFMSNDDAVAAQNQAHTAVDPSPSHEVMANPSLRRYSMDPLLNPNMSNVAINQIVPSVSLLDVYVNPMNRQMLHPGLYSPAYPQNMFLGGLGGFNQFGMNSSAQNANLMAALRGDLRGEDTAVAESEMHLSTREEQKVAREGKAKGDPPSGPKAT